MSEEGKGRTRSRREASLRLQAIRRSWTMQAMGKAFSRLLVVARLYIPKIA